MTQALPTTAALLSANLNLPSAVRQNMVKLDFVAPIPRLFVQEFMRIRFTSQMKLGGETPQHDARICPKCRTGFFRKVSDVAATCFNPFCGTFEKPQNIARPQGVIQVLIPEDCITVVDGRDVCSSLVLVLDRKYREEVLAAVYRTAGMICDNYGWRIK